MVKCPRCGGTKVKKSKTVTKSQSGYYWVECTCKKCGRVFMEGAGPGA